MKFAKDASGEFLKFGDLERLLVVIISSYMSFVLLNYVNVKPLLESIIPLRVPFKGLAVLGGFTFIFWIALTYRVCGKGYGVAVSLLTVSLCLFVSPWYEIVTPYWFGIVGFFSFLVAGIITERLNGGIALVACVLINWIFFSVYVASVDVRGVILLSIVAFVSGFIGDLIAKKVSKIALNTV